MKLFIKENSSWSVEKLEVLDEKGNVCYMAEGESLNNRNTIRIFDKDKEEIGIVKKNAVGLLSSFYVEIYNELFGTIQPAMNVFRTKFDVDLFGWTVKGTRSRNRYRIYKDDSEIARIDYMLDGTNASYEIDFSNPEDKLPIILLVLTIYTIYSYKFSQRAGCQ